MSVGISSTASGEATAYGYAGLQEDRCSSIARINTGTDVGLVYAAGHLDRVTRRRGIDGIAQAGVRAAPGLTIRRCVVGGNVYVEGHRAHDFRGSQEEKDRRDDDGNPGRIHRDSQIGHHSTV